MVDDLGETKCGVTTMISSLSSRSMRVERKKAPNTGILPRPGMRSLLFTVLRLTNPLIMKVSPGARETVVSERRTRKPGTDTPSACTPELKSISLTSGATFRIIWSSSITVGVSANPIPKFLYSTCVEPRLSTPRTGTGNSPPDKKVAVCPLKAVRDGSARAYAKPPLSRALIAVSALALSRVNANPEPLVALRKPTRAAPPKLWYSKQKLFSLERLTSTTRTSVCTWVPKGKVWPAVAATTTVLRSGSERPRSHTVNTEVPSFLAVSKISVASLTETAATSGSEVATREIRFIYVSTY